MVPKYPLCERAKWSRSHEKIVPVDKRPAHSENVDHWKTPVKPYSLQEAGPTSCIIRIICKEYLFLQEKWHLGTVQGVILYKVLAFFLLSPSNQYPVVFHRILFKHANLISNLHQMCTSCSCVHMGVTSLVTVIAAVSLRRLLPSYCLILFLFWVTSFSFFVKIWRE